LIIVLALEIKEKEKHFNSRGLKLA
jgi:hypothetical protein